MLCPRCHGTHYVLTNGQRLPCPECGGLGEINCCDGLMEQPEELTTETQGHREDEKQGEERVSLPGGGCRPSEPGR